MKKVVIAHNLCFLEARKILRLFELSVKVNVISKIPNCKQVLKLARFRCRYAESNVISILSQNVWFHFFEFVIQLYSQRPF